MSFLFVKWLHILGASILFGTGVGIAFFAWFGYRMGMKSDNIGLVQGTLRLTVIADTVFTALNAVVQPITGFAMFFMTGGRFDNAWIWWVLGLYALVGACWLPVVVLQIRLRDGALAAKDVSSLPPEFHRTFRLWFILGWPAFLAMMGLFALMVTRGYFMT